MDFMEIVLRPATPEDAESLAAVEVASWQTAYKGLMPDAYLDALSKAEQTTSWHKTLVKHGVSRRKRVLIAIGNGEVLGFVRVGPVAEQSQEGLVYLLYVFPQYWRHGVGKTLMEAAMRELHNLGMSEATLWVLRDNSRARQFYEKLGWRWNGQHVADPYGDIELEALCYQRTVKMALDTHI